MDKQQFNKVKALFFATKKEAYKYYAWQLEPDPITIYGANANNGYLSLMTHENDKWGVGGNWITPNILFKKGDILEDYIGVKYIFKNELKNDSTISVVPFDNPKAHRIHITPGHILFVNGKNIYGLSPILAKLLKNKH